MAYLVHPTIDTALEGGGGRQLCGYNIVKFTFADIDECASTPCENDATCKDGVNSYTCECKDGFTGKNCEQSKGGTK